MRKPVKRAVLTSGQLFDGLRRGDRAVLGRAVTLIESTNSAHRAQAQEVLQQVLPYTGDSIRIGISGVPGVGKSTFIEALGQYLIAEGKKVAVLAVDPTSARTGGSILGDKTRMQNLSTSPGAFIRPSPTSGTLGGVNRVTRETILLCEAANFDVVIVETVGVGQSETMVATMVDFFLVLMLPGAGDDLQGIKRGVMEVADMIVVNKSDGDNIRQAASAVNDYTHAIRTLSSADSAWLPPVLHSSALHNTGIDEVWKEVLRHRDIVKGNGEHGEKRNRQLLHWLDSTLQYRLLEDFRACKVTAALFEELRNSVLQRELTPAAASERLISSYLSNPNER